ncbi:glycosyltransferase family 2 protein [Stenotrophomonas sp. TWI819]|uniref:glycosyltransferase family 2 protein n=1 Tax=Stenotrophomonas sp. TWI819 TaxID=3136800 RepID=UPI003208C917
MQQLLNPTLTVVVPVYGNEGSIAKLIAALASIKASAQVPFEAVFVVDGSPDQSYARLREQLPSAGFDSQLIALSRNFGAFSAIRVGLEHAKSSIIAVMAADLQEPPELVLELFKTLAAGDRDIAMGVRESRDDPGLSKLASEAFWALYRRFVMPDIPKGGVDIFAVTHLMRDRLLQLKESNTSLLAQLFWLGGRRQFVPYRRLRREHGKSAWTFKKKLRYLSDSVFSFTDLPIRLLIGIGVLSLGAGVGLSMLILAAKISGLVAVPGYAGTMVAILFFGALNSLGLGVVGAYAWRTFENTKARPLSILQSLETFTERD